MRDARIQLRVFLLPSEDKPPSSVFWPDVNASAKLSDDLDDFDQEVLQRLENLFDSIRKRVHQKRALASLKMTIIKDLECAVKVTLHQTFLLTPNIYSSTHSFVQQQKEKCSS